MIKIRSILLVWGFLLALLGLTMASSMAFSGAVGLAVGLSIALAKTGFIAWQYMHLGEQPGLARIAAIGALAWLIILFSMTGLDYITR